MGNAPQDLFDFFKKSKRRTVPVGGGVIRTTICLFRSNPDILFLCPRWSRCGGVANALVGQREDIFVFLTGQSGMFGKRHVGVLSEDATQVFPVFESRHLLHRGLFFCIAKEKRISRWSRCRKCPAALPSGFEKHSHVLVIQNGRAGVANTLISGVQATPENLVICDLI